MAAVTVVSYFLEEVDLTEYFDWITIAFWIAFGCALGFGGFFLIDGKRWWTGLVSGAAIVAMVIITLIDVLIYGKFPLLPGVNLSTLYLISLLSVGSLGIITAKTVSDKRHGDCIPFLENCSIECKDGVCEN